MQCFAKRFATAIKNQCNKSIYTTSLVHDSTDDDSIIHPVATTLSCPSLINKNHSESILRNSGPFSASFTSPLKNASFNKPVQSDQNASASLLCHLLNNRVLEQIDSPVVAGARSDLDASKPPPEWIVMHQIGYSPAQFNLGLWYHQSNSPRNIPKAEFYYREAFNTDGHPQAAYNLACLLIKKNGGFLSPEIMNLMQHSSDSGVPEAREFIDANSRD